jgi:catechol 2,3-dioxygenase-like lactoylglutathione lyase family enzyme
MDRPEIDSQIVFLYTDDLDKTHHFYHRIMGFPLALDQVTCRIYRVCHQGYIGFCSKSDLIQSDSNIIFTIVTRDVDGWFNYLKAAGVKIIEKPAINPPYQIYHFFLHDPNGYKLEIQTFLNPEWDKR